MHSNEIRITAENKDRLIEEAERMGKGHVAALMEQIDRQNGKTK